MNKFLAFVFLAIFSACSVAQGLPPNVKPVPCPKAGGQPFLWRFDSREEVDVFLRFFKGGMDLNHMLQFVREMDALGFKTEAEEYLKACFQKEA